ncbi:MAG: fluoride efflux transporter CrcB [Candidatus Kapaibacterium sp.]|nr:MAG: fluoride efflux transporter CrcB [Candidatus Kapabacteria bacterium]
MNYNSLLRNIFMIQTFLLITIGGGLGSAARFAVSLLVSHFTSNTAQTGFPLATFLVNIIGSFVLGGVVALTGERVNALSAEWRYFLAVGFCGGFTTFSTLSLELFTMLQEGRFGAAFGYISVSIFLGIASVGAGLGLVYWLNKALKP